MTESTVARPSSSELADFCVECAAEKMALAPVTLPVRDVSSITDFFVVASAESEPQLRAMASNVERKVREKYGIRPLSDSGAENGGWMLIDFGGVVVHLMSREMRSRYDLEGLWGAVESRRQ